MICAAGNVFVATSGDRFRACCVELTAFRFAPQFENVLRVITG